MQRGLQPLGAAPVAVEVLPGAGPAFGPTGGRLVSIPLLTDGLGPRDVFLRSTGGRLVAHYRTAGWFGTLAWESATALLLDTNGTVKSATVRCVVADCERASRLRPVPTSWCPGSHSAGHGRRAAPSAARIIGHCSGSRAKAAAFRAVRSLPAASAAIFRLPGKTPTSSDRARQARHAAGRGSPADPARRPARPRRWPGSPRGGPGPTPASAARRTAAAPGGRRR